jgi:hypothetical protein
MCHLGRYSILAYNNNNQVFVPSKLGRLEMKPTGAETETKTKVKKKGRGGGRKEGK